MQVYIDEKAIKRKGNLGKILAFGGLGAGLAALFLSTRMPEHINTIFFVALAGLFLSQIGISLVNRWSRSPRVDEILSAAVKGLDSNFHLFHYKLGADHVLVSPTGVYILVPALQDGRVVFEEDGKKWFVLKKRRNKLKKRRIKDLQGQIEREISSAERKLRSIFPDNSDLQVSPIVVFLHRDAQVKLDNAPYHCVHGKKIKPLLRKLQKETPLSEEETQTLIETVS